METTGQQLALAGPHWPQLQSGFWKFYASQSSMKAQPKARGQAQRRCFLAQVTSRHGQSGQPCVHSFLGHSRHGDWFSSPSLGSPGRRRREGLSQQLGGVRILVPGAQFFSFFSSFGKVLLGKAAPSGRVILKLPSAQCSSAFLYNPDSHGSLYLWGPREQVGLRAWILVSVCHLMSP